MTEDSPAIKLADLGAQLKRRWLVLVVTTVLCISAATAFALVRAPVYSATSVLTVQPITANPFGNSSSSSKVNITTERAVILSTEVGKRAGEIMETSVDPHDLVERISVTSPLDSEVMEITASAGTADEAAATANAFAMGYLDVRTTAAGADAERLIKNIDGRIAELRETLTDDQNSRAAESLQQQINELSDQRSALSMMAINPGRVITVATPPSAPSSFGWPVYVAVGFAGGLLLGLVLAFLRERTDRRVGSGPRLASILGLPVVDEQGGEVTDELLNRLIMRLDLDHDASLIKIGTLGTDSTTAELLTSPLANRLLGFGYRTQFTQASRDDSADDQGSDRAQGKANVVLISASITDGIARAALLAQRVDKVAVVTHRGAALQAVVRLLDELTVAGAPADVVVVLSLPRGRESRRDRVVSEVSRAEAGARPDQPMDHLKEQRLGDVDRSGSSHGRSRESGSQLAGDNTVIIAPVERPVRP